MASPFSLLLAFLLTLSVNLHTCRADMEFLKSTCQQTRSYSLCFSTFRTDPRSVLSTTTAELLAIFVDIADDRTSATASYMFNLAKQYASTPLARPLFLCGQAYTTAHEKLAEARSDVAREEFMDAYDAITTATEAPARCGAAIESMVSPAVSKNNAEKDLLEILLDIADLMNGP
ncbi:Cell wall / vacuolar inhibitor of fructosidase 2 [Apostasia shenzhenica]|uniref:Cell wall / vacuolar inhibitor of fructosidase 2 n=1 Tax=Apostasia shenzhenica TaxID=1088818 RepID=A0A2I0A0Z0_9ASPA|nr:Cell wall / vacuolar inhibitor of fructosidase 2 [Apostasia shenzhenica]